MKNKVLFMLLFCIMLFSMNSEAFAQTSFSPTLSRSSLLTSYRISYIINNNLLVVELADEKDVFFVSDAKISLSGLNEDASDTTLLWSAKTPKIYDLQLLNNPDKIVIICAKDNYLQKLESDATIYIVSINIGPLPERKL